MNQQLTGLQLVQLRAQLRQAAQRGEIREVELEAAEQAVHGVVAVDDNLDG